VEARPHAKGPAGASAVAILCGAVFMPWCRESGAAATSQILDPSRSDETRAFGPTFSEHISKGLILAQNERWRRGLGMQVVRPARDEAQG
jgi:hypothetical protein